jgi:hypothetical protein
MSTLIEVKAPSVWSVLLDIHIMKSSNWEPLALKAFPASLTLIAHMVLLACIAALMIISKAHNGLSNVGYINDAFPFSMIGRDGMCKIHLEICPRVLTRRAINVQLSASILWESLPPLILQLFTLLRNWMADEAGFREPFAELGRENGRDEEERHVGSDIDIDQSRCSSSYFVSTGDSSSENTKTLETDLPDDARSSTPPTRSHGSKFNQEPKPNAHLTVLLDYRSYDLIRRWWYALRNGHPHLALAFVLSVIFLAFATPFSAALVRDAEVEFDGTVELTTAFSLIKDFPLEIEDWTEIILASESEDVYGARHASWTNATHAFQPFSPDPEVVLYRPLEEWKLQRRGGVSIASVYREPRVTAPSQAHTVQLDCAMYGHDDLIADNGNLKVSFEPFDGLATTYGLVTLKLSDRGCDIEHEFRLGDSNRPVAIEAVSQNCTASQGPTRLVFLIAQAATVPPSDLTANGSSSNITGIPPWLQTLIIASCISSYQSTPGLLTVSWPLSEAEAIADQANRTDFHTASLRPTIHDFTPTSGPVANPSFLAHVFEGNITNVYHTDGSWFGDISLFIFSRQVVERVVALHCGTSLRRIVSAPTSPSEPRSDYVSHNFTLPLGSAAERLGLIMQHAQLLPAAMESTLASAYRIALSLHGFKDVPFFSSTTPNTTNEEQPGPGVAAITTQQRRILIRTWMGMTLLALIGLSMLSTVWLIYRRRVRPCPLAEKPEGLLAYACLLHQGPGDCGHNISKPGNCQTPDQGPNVISTMLQESNTLAARVVTEPLPTSAAKSTRKTVFGIWKRNFKQDSTSPKTRTRPSKVARQLWTIDEAHFYLGSLSAEETGEGGPRMLMARNLHRKEAVAT